jgi:hypothetical protein
MNSNGGYSNFMAASHQSLMDHEGGFSNTMIGGYNSYISGSTDMALTALISAENSGIYSDVGTLGASSIFSSNNVNLWNSYNSTIKIFGNSIIIDDNSVEEFVKYNSIWSTFSI